MSRMYSCDNCDIGNAHHHAESNDHEGTFCCECAHCGDPETCEQEWLDEQTPTKEYSRAHS